MSIMPINIPSIESHMYIHQTDVDRFQSQLIMSVCLLKNEYSRSSLSFVFTLRVDEIPLNQAQTTGKKRRTITEFPNGRDDARNILVFFFYFLKNLYVRNIVGFFLCVTDDNEVLHSILNKSIFIRFNMTYLKLMKLDQTGFHC